MSFPHSHAHTSVPNPLRARPDLSQSSQLDSTVSSKKRTAEEATTEGQEEEVPRQPPHKATKLMDQPTSSPAEDASEQHASAVVEHPYESFEDLLFNNMRMEALDEMERSIRYVLDVNDDFSALTGGFFRHGMFGALADMSGSSVISHIYDHLTPGSMLDMKLSVQSALQAPTTVRIESRVKRHGDTLAFVSTHFYTDDRSLARAKTTHYIASASARRPPTHASNP